MLICGIGCQDSFELLGGEGLQAGFKIKLAVFSNSSGSFKRFKLPGTLGSAISTCLTENT